MNAQEANKLTQQETRAGRTTLERNGFTAPPRSTGTLYAPHRGGEDGSELTSSEQAAISMYV
jgi:hypothetical protein